MQSHIVLRAVFALFVSVVLGVIAKDELRDQRGFGGMVLGGVLACGVGVGWLGV